MCNSKYTLCMETIKFHVCSTILLITMYYQITPGLGRDLSKGVASNQIQSDICASTATIHGYRCQEFDVKTEDGYIISVQRIPEGKFGGGRTVKGQPVILQHGVLADGLSWFVNSPEQNLPTILADRGFDVWIVNSRGTRFSRRHIFLQPTQPEFWNWSWDDLAIYELPAVVGYVYHQTGQKAHFIGHSQGTTVALASLSKGLLVDKLKSAALLSPIAYMSSLKTPIVIIAANTFVDETFKKLGITEFNLAGQEERNIIGALCADSRVDCYDMLTATTGKNCCLNASTVDLYFKNEPQPTSVKNLGHFAQIIRNKVFAKYNYGNVGDNLMHYAESSPPIYKLSNISHDLPLFLSYGGQDALSDVDDVAHLLGDLMFDDAKKPTAHYVEEYAHIDFVMGVNAKDVVYNQMISFLNRNN